MDKPPHNISPEMLVFEPVWEFRYSYWLLCNLFGKYAYHDLR